MNYIEEGKKPPKCKSVISTPEELVEALRPLIGQTIPMTGKSRTDGSNFRKIVTNHLLSNYMPEAADEYEIVPPKQKGVPAFLREYIDTYIVTTGNSYNLQVWNRNPNSASVQVDLKNGETLLASDVRFVLGKINADNCIESIVVMTPDYIENRFGKFGKPTVKQQLIISNKKREYIIRDGGMVIADSNLPQEILASGDETVNADVSIKDEPNKVLPIEIIDERISDKLIGKKLDISLSTKQRGQQLERMVAYQLGYSGKQDSLEGGYPDIRNQMLEVKVQDSPTIDLGKYSPQFEEQINDNFTTRTIRYLIALTNAMDGAIDEMLEDGQYTDLDGKIVDLDGYIIVFTANLNSTNFKDMIPEPLFSRFDMTYEFQPLSYDDKMKFVSDFADKLLLDYAEYTGEVDTDSIKKLIIEENYQNYDNLRSIKRSVMNCFVRLVGNDSAWKESVNSEKGDSSCH